MKKHRTQPEMVPVNRDEVLPEDQAVSIYNVFMDPVVVTDIEPGRRTFTFVDANGKVGEKALMSAFLFFRVKG